MFGINVKGVCPKCSKVFGLQLGMTAVYSDKLDLVYNRCRCPLCGADVLIKAENRRDGLMRRYSHLSRHRLTLDSLVDSFTAMAELPDASDYAKEIKGAAEFAQFSYEDLVTLVEMAQLLVADLKESTVLFSDSFDYAGTICY